MCHLVRAAGLAHGAFVHMGCPLVLLPVQVSPGQPWREPRSAPLLLLVWAAPGKGCNEGALQIVVAIISAASRVVARQTEVCQETHCCCGPAHSTGSLSHPPW